MATKDQALSWINGGWRTDKYAKTIPAAGGLGIDVDGVDGFQCKDFANGLGYALGAPLVKGNAIVLAQKLSDGWSYVSDPQPGDLGIRNYVSGGVNYGDVAAITSVNGTTINTVGQNQVNSSLTIGHVPTASTRQFKDFIKFMRRDYEDMSTPTTSNQVSELYGAFTGRQPNKSEVESWIGRPLELLVQSLYEAPESQAYYVKVSSALAGKPTGTKLAPGNYTVE